MLFNSIGFIILVLATLFFYYLPVLKQFQVYILIAASFIFYANTYPLLLLLLVCSIATNVLTSYYTFYSKKNKRRIIATLGVIANLATLAFFKYSPLFSKTFLNPTDNIGEFLLLIPLPIGISFFTFQGISLLVDTFSNKYNFEKNNTIPNNIWEQSFKYIVLGYFLKMVIADNLKDFTFELEWPYFERLSSEYPTWTSQKSSDAD